MARILALHAHPDDIEWLCAGTLARLSRLGHEVVLATATAGEGGSAEHDAETTGHIRRAEAASAADLIGAAYHCLGLTDLGVFNDDPTRRAVTAFIRTVAPDIVITAPTVDYHPDHEATGTLVRDACFAAPVANYRTGSAAALSRIPHLYITDSVGGRDRTGARHSRDFGVDVADMLEIKRAMLARHESQAAWTAKHHGIADQLAGMTLWTERVGRDFGVTAAEGFRQYRHEPYPRSPALQELLGDGLLAVPDRAAS
jgi:N-acetylglucosamine malate deacetylase 1